MINLAGNENCDEVIKRELEEAGVKYTEFSVVYHSREVPSKVIGEYKGWKFIRAWYYWVASAGDGTLLPFEIAVPLHESHGKDIRVAGYAGGIAPREWYNKAWHAGVGLYHIDTQEGLNELVKAIDLSTNRQGKDK